MEMFYDFDGNPISMWEWSELRASLSDDTETAGPGARWLIGRTRISDDPFVEVSTVWIGLDMGYGFITGGPPLIFETMIFGGPLDLESWRYATAAEAECGHAEAVELATLESTVAKNE